MKRLFAVTVVLAVVASAVPALASETSVGDFIVKLAETKNVGAVDSRGAVEALRTVGVRLPSDLKLDAPLTEGEVIRIATLAGLNVRTSQPSRSFGRLQVERFFASFASELDTTSLLRHEEGPPCDGGTDCPNPGQGGGPGNGNGGPPFDPFSKGKGKHKGKAKAHQTPEEPE